VDEAKLKAAVPKLSGRGGVGVEVEEEDNEGRNNSIPMSSTGTTGS